MLHSAASRWKIVLSFACIYLIWGSTYLAIKYAIAEVSPLMMTAARFFTASFLLLLVARLRHESKLSKPDCLIAFESGCFLALANALVCVSEKWISSGTAAVLCGASPIMILLMNWFFFEGKRPNPRQSIGILISFAGVFLLSRLQTSVTFSSESSGGILAVFGAILLWSVGSLVQRRSGPLPNVFRFTAFQLFCGACSVLVLGMVFEQPSQIHVEQLSLSSWLAFFYLVIFGSAVAFSAYLFLHRHVESAQVSTYAVVNPMIAVWLGWLIANEPLNHWTVLYSMLVLVGLYFAVISPKKRLAPH